MSPVNEGHFETINHQIQRIKSGSIKWNFSKYCIGHFMYKSKLCLKFFFNCHEKPGELRKTKNRNYAVCKKNFKQAG